MPIAAPRPCSHVGCGVLVRGASRCEAHKVQAGSFADRRRGTRHERGYGTAWDKRRAQVLQRDAGICQHCLRETGAVHEGTEVDHRVPKAQGGSDDLSNLQTICRPAHRAKTQAEASAGRSGAPAGAAGQGRGGQKSASRSSRTDQYLAFSCVQVLEGGG